jgi:hypothetical protein
VIKRALLSKTSAHIVRAGVRRARASRARGRAGVRASFPLTLARLQISARRVYFCCRLRSGACLVRAVVAVTRGEGGGGGGRLGTGATGSGATSNESANPHNILHTFARAPPPVPPRATSLLQLPPWAFGQSRASTRAWGLDRDGKARRPGANAHNQDPPPTPITRGGIRALGRGLAKFGVS